MQKKRKEMSLKFEWWNSYNSVEVLIFIWGIMLNNFSCYCYVHAMNGFLNPLENCVTWKWVRHPTSIHQFNDKSLTNKKVHTCVCVCVWNFCPHDLINHLTWKYFLYLFVFISHHHSKLIHFPLSFRFDIVVDCNVFSTVRIFSFSQKHCFRCFHIWWYIPYMDGIVSHLYLWYETIVSCCIILINIYQQYHNGCWKLKSQDSLFLFPK